MIALGEHTDKSIVEERRRSPHLWRCASASACGCTERGGLVRANRSLQRREDRASPLHCAKDSDLEASMATPFSPKRLG